MKNIQLSRFLSRKRQQYCHQCNLFQWYEISKSRHSSLLLKVIYIHILDALFTFSIVPTRYMCQNHTKTDSEQMNGKKRVKPMSKYFYKTYTTRYTALDLFIRFWIKPKLWLGKSQSINKLWRALYVCVLLLNMRCHLRASWIFYLNINYMIKYCDNMQISVRIYRQPLWLWRCWRSPRIWVGFWE